MNALDSTPMALSAKDRSKLERQNRAEPREHIIFKVPEVDLTDITKRVSEVLSQTALSKPISTLEQFPKLAQWVHEGMEIHDELNQHEKCGFCDQIIPQARLLALEEHFSNEFELLQQSIDKLITEIEKLLKDISSISLPERIQSRPICKKTLSKRLLSIKIVLQ